jgi:hypothetical protein
MTNAVCTFLRRDHDDIDRGLVHLLDPSTRVDEVPGLLEVVRLALAVHVAAQSKMFETLVHALSPVGSIRLLVRQSRVDHAAQRRRADALASMRPGSVGFHEQVSELRSALLRHGRSLDELEWILRDHVSPRLRQQLASEYVTERMRVLASTSPHLAADRRHSAPGQWHND